MSLRSCVSAAAIAAAILASGGVQAGQDHDDYHVIPGVGPETSQAHYPPQRRSHLGYPSMNAAPTAPYDPTARIYQVHAPKRLVVSASVQASAHASVGLGGGFLELLATGRTPKAQPVVVEPADQVVSHQRLRGGYAEPAQEYYEIRPRAPRVQQAAYAPEAGFPSRRIDPRYERQEVDYHGRHAPGTIVVDTPNRFLYLVTSRGRAIRYGIGVGRPGFEWAGVKHVSRKSEWPDWRPPAEMLKRRPDLPTYMKGGPDNPLGARALYLGSSLYRIHGTNEPWTIGKNVSSGCIRMMNEDVTDLYARVSVGAKVIVM